MTKHIRLINLQAHLGDASVAEWVRPLLMNQIWGSLLEGEGVVVHPSTEPLDSILVGNSDKDQRIVHIICDRGQVAAVPSAPIVVPSDPIKRKEEGFKGVNTSAPKRRKTDSSLHAPKTAASPPGDVETRIEYETNEPVIQIGTAGWSKGRDRDEAWLEQFECLRQFKAQHGVSSFCNVFAALSFHLTY